MMANAVAVIGDVAWFWLVASAAAALSRFALDRVPAGWASGVARTVRRRAALARGRLSGLRPATLANVSPARWMAELAERARNAAAAAGELRAAIPAPRLGAVAGRARASGRFFLVRVRGLGVAVIQLARSRATPAPSPLAMWPDPHPARIDDLESAREPGPDRSGAAAERFGRGPRTRIHWGSLRRPAAIAATIVVALPLTATTPFWALPCRTRGCQVDDWITRERQPPGLLDRRGEPLWRPDPPPFVRLADLPPYVPAMAVAVEDKRFRGHPGVDPLAVGRAALAALTGGMRQGASTITMQAVRQLDRDDDVYPDGTVAGKVAETRLALGLEWRLTKDEILELYLNTLDLSSDGGRPIRGIEDGARTFFGKPASRVTPQEAAVLIGMVQAPSRYHPRYNPEQAKARARFVLARLEQRAPELEVTGDGFSGRLRVAPAPLWPSAPPVAALVAASTAERGTDVTTTLDRRLQEVMEREVGGLIERAEADPRYRRQRGNWLVAAAIVLEARTGAILGYSCGRPNDDFERWDPCRFGQVPFASTLKPWLALAAFQHGVARPWQTLRELEHRAGYPHTRDAYIATLRDRSQERLDWTVTDAFARSDNYLAVLLFRLLPPRAVADLQRLGIALDEDHPAEALGSLTKTPLEMAALTAALANGGRLLTPRVLATQPMGERHDVAWGAAPIASVHRLMAEVVEEGTGARAGHALGPARRGFAKTGTDGARGLLITGFVEPGGAVVFLWIGHRQPLEVFPDATAGALLGHAWGTIANAAAAAAERLRMEERAPMRLARR